ncbi:hypothetical protein Q4577_06090 [Marinovum sp. 2_MG-2023]|uniref:hypothetical protein n=1 Tax=unclassified Marinovum TaxID=2647166 RepID=UPI0026E2EA3D|nr:MULTISPECIES: hypothetical protein [unclassified Marinovum]MDO6729580.1 hypothetical protein [Marinovum sp. 2_MG-2023]MDO6780266.1 hypothetical protein [Marinovum sp. 1_MG-2023]
MNALLLLCELIAQGCKGSASFYGDNHAFAALLRNGYLCESGVVGSVVCNDCEEAHAAPVVCEAGCYGYFCPDRGFVPVRREDVQAVSPDVPKLIQALADSFECKRRKATALHGTTWRIGAIETDQGDVMLFFHPCLRDESDLLALGDALSREMRSTWRLVVTAEGSATVDGTVAVSLGELVDLDSKDGRLLPLSDPRTLVGVPPRNLGGAPNRFGHLLIAIIEERVRSGQAMLGRNEEAKVVLVHFERKHPDLKPPSLSSVKDYVTKIRTGQ